MSPYMSRIYCLLFILFFSASGFYAPLSAQDYYLGPDTSLLLQPVKEKKQRKKKKSDEDKDVLQNPNGFEMYGTDSPPEIDYNIAPSPATTEEVEPTVNEDKRGRKREKDTTDKPQKRKKGDNNENAKVINLDLGTLYQFNLTDTVIVQDKRKKTPEVSFKAKEDIKYYYNQAVLKINNSNYEDALELLNKCVGRDPNNKDALQMRANCYTELKKYRQAIADYNKALKIDPKDPILLYNKASTLIKMGKFEDAVQTFDKSISFKPDYVFALQGRASAKTLNGDYQGAIEDYSLVLDQNPLFLSALKGRGVAKGLLKRYDDAVGDFSSVIDLQPSDGMAYYYRGLAYISLNQPFKGCTDFDKAYQLNVKQAYFDIKEFCR